MKGLVSTIAIRPQIIDYFVVVDLSMYVALDRVVHQLRKPRNVAVIYLFCRLKQSPEVS